MWLWQELTQHCNQINIKKKKNNNLAFPPRPWSGDWCSKDLSCPKAPKASHREQGTNSSQPGF